MRDHVTLFVVYALQIANDKRRRSRIAVAYLGQEKRQEKIGDPFTLVRNL